MKTFLLTLMISLAAMTVLAQSIPNPGFEVTLADTVFGVSRPVGWSTTQFGVDVPTSPVGGGSRSLLIWNWYTYAEAYARNGVADEMDMLIYPMKGGTPITGRPVSLTGMYLYDTTSTITDHDSAIVTVALKRWNATLLRPDTVSLATLRLPATPNMVNFLPFEVMLPDMMPGVLPDSIVVTFGSSVEGTCVTDDCLYFYVDELSLTFTGVDGERVQVPFELFPNPSQGLVHLRLETPGADEVQILDLQGRQVARAAVPAGEKEVALRLGHLPSGIYWAQLLSQGQPVGGQKIQLH